MSTQPTRRPRAAKPEEPQHQSRLAPAFDRDALALSFLYEKQHISRAEFRANLRLLGVQLDDEEPRRLAVPQVIAIQATVVQEPEPIAEEDDELPVDDEDRWWEREDAVEG